MIRYLFFVCLGLLPLFGFSQDSGIGNWLIYIGSKKIDNKLNLHHEIQYRNYNAIGDLEQLLLRTGLGYDLGDNVNGLLGYGFIRSENYQNSNDKVVVNEHRIFQQVVLKQNPHKFRLQHRYRFEQRFVEDNFKLRFRYFLSIQHPVWKNGIKELYISIYDEVFLNTVDAVFDRNRLYGGLGYRLNTNLKLELGYMNQFLNNGSRDQVNVFCFYNW